MARLFSHEQRTVSAADEEREDLRRQLKELAAENESLRAACRRANAYIRSRTDRLLQAAGTVPLRAEELDDATLLELDPIGIVAESFTQILAHSSATTEALRVAHSEIAAVFDSVGASILVLDPDHRIRSYNREAAEKLLDHHPAPEGLLCYQVVCGREAPRARCSLCGALRIEGVYRNRDWVNRGRHYDVIATPLRGRSGEISRVVSVYLDITDRLLAQQALAASEERYRDLVENAHDLIQSVGPDGRFEFVNEAWLERLGYSREELAALTVADVLDFEESSPDGLLAAHRRGGGPQVAVVYRAKNGERVVLEGNVNEVPVSEGKVATRAIFRDVTELRRAREEAARAERLEAVGLLAGGIAHDFNNLLTAVLHNLSLLQTDLPEHVHPRLAGAETAILRAQGLTQQLLTFSRGGEPVRQPVTLSPLFHEAMGFALAGSAVLLSVECAPDLPAVYADPAQLGQVLQNLAINAAQAMGGKGKLWVRAMVCPPPPGADPEAANRPWVQITVQDNGPGIPSAHLERIFDPYFTTRSDGTGLGLATVHSIVQRHGGHLGVTSTPGAGAQFSIHLPALDERDAVGVAPTNGVPKTGSGRVLLMDDDDAIRETASELLVSAGYAVETAADGAAAVDQYRTAAARGAPFDLVIMDLTVPGGMGGAEAIQHLRKLDPNVVAVVSSGYSNDPVMANYRDHGFTAVVPKPYRMATLVDLLDSLLPTVPQA